MCVGYLEKHTECGHIKKFHVIDPCSSGSDESGYCLDARPETAHVRFITQPALCVNCYRRAETQICLKFDRAILNTEMEIDLVKRMRRMEREEKDRAAATKTITELEEELGDLIDSRSEDLHEFRAQQGVWGDG